MSPVRRSYLITANIILASYNYLNYYTPNLILNEESNNINLKKGNEKMMIKESIREKRRRKKNVAVYAELSDSSSGNRDIPVQILVKETLTSTALDALEDSEEVVKAISKSLVMDILKDSETPGQLGTLLSYIFTSETVLSPTRELIYWSLFLPPTMKNITLFSKSQRDYFLNNDISKYKLALKTKTEENDGERQGEGEGEEKTLFASSVAGSTNKSIIKPETEGFHYTKQNLLNVASWWCLDPQSMKDSMSPLFHSYITDKEYVEYVAMIASQWWIPDIKKDVANSAVEVIKDSLRSDETKAYAKEAAVSILSSYIKDRISSSSSNGSGKP